MLHVFTATNILNKLFIEIKGQLYACTARSKITSDFYLLEKKPFLPKETKKANLMHLHLAWEGTSFRELMAVKK